jgi:ABC-type amino acid transport substrate-binding protein
MRVTLEFVPTAFDGIIPSLIAGKFDGIIGGLTRTPAAAHGQDRGGARHCTRRFRMSS